MDLVKAVFLAVVLVTGIFVIFILFAAIFPFLLFGALVFVCWVLIKASKADNTPPDG